MKTIIATLGLVIATVATPASAQVFQALPDIFTGTSPNTFGDRYIGPAGTGPSGRRIGAIDDGGFNAFDIYGYYIGVPGQLSQFRQTELLAGTNTYRFFDTFTNTSSTTYSGQLTFFGLLGTGDEEIVLRNAAGVAVSCVNDHLGGCVGNPVATINYGDVASATLNDGQFRATYDLTLAPGESGSILSFASLTRGVNGPDATSRSQALAIGRALAADPNVSGLSARQLATLVNFDVAVPTGVPEPASWMMMIAGFGAVGAIARRRNGATHLAVIV